MHRHADTALGRFFQRRESEGCASRPVMRGASSARLATAEGSCCGDITVPHIPKCHRDQGAATHRQARGRGPDRPSVRRTDISAVRSPHRPVRRRMDREWWYAPAHPCRRGTSLGRLTSPTDRGETGESHAPVHRCLSGSAGVRGQRLVPSSVRIPRLHNGARMAGWWGLGGAVGQPARAAPAQRSGSGRQQAPAVCAIVLVPVRRHRGHCASARAAPDRPSGRLPVNDRRGRSRRTTGVVVPLLHAAAHAGADLRSPHGYRSQEDHP